MIKIKDLEFDKSIPVEGNILYTADITTGRITVLDRLTGFGDGDIRDIESGFTDRIGGFWLVSGGFDIRTHKDLSVEDAVSLIKESANHHWIYKKKVEQKS